MKTLTPLAHDLAPPSLLAQAMAVYRPKPEGLLPVPDQADLTTASLLDQAAGSAMAAMFGPDVQPRTALRKQIAANADLLATGDNAAMSAALARQATALDLAMYGLLAALAAAKTTEQRLTLAKAVATIHGAALRSLSAIRQLRHGSEQAS